MADLDSAQHRNGSADKGLLTTAYGAITRPDSVRAAQRALNAARQAMQDARERAEAGAPDTAAAMDDAARRYERAMALLRDARGSDWEYGRSRS